MDVNETVVGAQQKAAETHADRQARQKKYSDRVRALHMVEGWSWDSTGFEPRPDQPTSPGGPAVPYIWRWTEVESVVHEMSDPSLGVGMKDSGEAEKTDRRVLVCRNPGLGEEYANVKTIFSNYQIVKVGESAPVHRHASSSIRVVLEGIGGWSTAEGERAIGGPRDIIVSQPFSWHDHGNDGPDDCIFINLIDVPLLKSLSTACWEFDHTKATGDKNKTAQDLQFPVNYSRDLYHSAGIIPKFVGSSIVGCSPLMSYKWDAVRASLDRFRSAAGSPYDGIIVELSNPVYGGSVVPTMAICAQLLRPGEKTLSHRHNTSSVYIVAEGEGYTQIGDTRFDWSKNDVFSLPPWYWHHHGNATKNDAVLYSISDSTVIEKLRLYMEERKTKDGSTEFVGAEAHRLVNYF